MTITTLKTLLVLAMALICLAPSLARVPSEASVPGGPFREDRRQRDAHSFSYRGAQGNRLVRQPNGNRWPRRASRDNLVFPNDFNDKLPNKVDAGQPDGDAIVFPSSSGGLPIWGWSTSHHKHPIKDKWPNSSSEFGYGPEDGPDTWPSNFPVCGGTRQSPININLGTVTSPPPGVETAIFFKYYDAPPLELGVANTGHSLQLTGNWSAGQIPRASALVLHGEYAVAEVHFHWGSDDDEGSEHFVQGDCYPLEMHVVHYKLEYGTIDEARKRKDGLAVLSYLFKIQAQKNPGLQRLIEASKHVIDPSSPRVAIPPFSLDKLAPPFTRNYASYLGSLTTPPCSEIVTWIVSLEPQYVSSEQIAKLRKLKRNDGTRMLFNFRPVQPLNGRDIKYVP